MLHIYLAVEVTLLVIAFVVALVISLRIGAWRKTP